jgi:DNA polymerase-3 subunit gamma/tau
VLRRVCEGEGIDAPDAALALIARGAHGSFRDAVSTLDQLAAATGSRISVQDVLQLVGGIEEDSLFRLCDTIVDRDTAGSLVQIEELAEQGQDIGRLVTELVEHLRQLLLVQHVGHVPESLPVTEETRERLREQANQLPEPTVLRLIDLLAIAVDDMRQGGDPRLPLELALVKITRPQSDLSRDSLAHRLEVLEARPHGAPVASERRHVSDAAAVVAIPADEPSKLEAVRDEPPPALPPLELDQLRDAWQRDVVDAVKGRSIPVSTLVAEARPVEIRGNTVTIEFAPAAGFHRTQIEDPKNLALLGEALFEVTGRRLRVESIVGAGAEPAEPEDARELSEEDVISLLKDTFDAEEVEEH